MTQNSASSGSSTRFEWMRSSSPAPFSKSQAGEWEPYPDVDNMIIEEAYTSDRDQAKLDGYTIDFKKKIQVSHSGPNKERHVKRMKCNKHDSRVREERYIQSPFGSKQYFAIIYNCISAFIIETMKILGLRQNELLSCDKTTVFVIVEKAALGILEEGKQLGKTCEAEWIATQLMERKGSGMKEVWERCATLYSAQSFLYRTMNETMRLIGSEEHEQVWRRKLHTLGPFCLLLWNNPFNGKPNKNIVTVYRGCNLSQAELDWLRSDCSQDSRPQRSFQSFISCTRNRSIAEKFGNCLLVMDVKHVPTVDLIPYSEYPSEEEVLLNPAVSFTVVLVNFDKVQNKHLISLNLNQQSSNKVASQTYETNPELNNRPSSQHEKNKVGYDARNKNNIGVTYICRICSLILRDPVQLICGHRQCKSCVETIEGENIKCPECSEETPKEEVLLDRGFKKDMQSLIIECSFCDKWSGPLKNYEDHIQDSHPNPPCEYCGKTFDSANSLDFHKVNQCDKVTVPCALEGYGCSNTILRAQMPEHYLSDQHQNAIITFIRRDLSKLINDQHERGSKMDIDTLPHTTATFSEDTTTQLQEVCETIDILASGTHTLNEDAQRLSNESLRLQNEIDALNKDVAALKLSIQEQNTYLDGLKPNQEILHQDVSSLKQNVEDKQFISYDGTLTWKIPNFKEKMTDAQSERQTSIYSSPFYSSPTGYKMRGRLYLHGDGNARRTHLSLFFVLMRSEYDPILKFPFNYKVTFCLYDQTAAQRHIIDSFRPDIKSNSFQRPRSEMNIASGIPKFFPLAMIQQEGNPYVRDDTMFIKIMVDFGDMAKTLLPYALSLNPGLPTNIQQVLIKQEAERRTQQTPSTSTNSGATGSTSQNNE